MSKVFDPKSATASCFPQLFSRSLVWFLEGFFTFFINLSSGRKWLKTEMFVRDPLLKINIFSWSISYYKLGTVCPRQDVIKYWPTLVLDFQWDVLFQFCFWRWHLALLMFLQDYPFNVLVLVDCLILVDSTFLMCRILIHKLCVHILNMYGED